MHGVCVSEESNTNVDICVKHVSSSHTVSDRVISMIRSSRHCRSMDMDTALNSLKPRLHHFDFFDFFKQQVVREAVQHIDIKDVADSLQVLDFFADRL